MLTPRHVRLLFLAITLAVLVDLGCVRNVQVCATYDRRLGRESVDRTGRQNMGASVCADMAPPDAPAD